MDHKLALHFVSESGRHAKTLFKKIHYDGENSIVYCRPFTGRSHQIRVHLHFLGFPIVNDPLYLKSQPACSSPESTENFVKAVSQKYKDEQGISSYCSECELEVLDDDTLESPIFLHAFRYSYPGHWQFETRPPSWFKMKEGETEVTRCEIACKLARIMNPFLVHRIESTAPQSWPTFHAEIQCVLKSRAESTMLSLSVCVQDHCPCSVSTPLP